MAAVRLRCDLPRGPSLRRPISEPPALRLAPRGSRRSVLAPRRVFSGDANEPEAAKPTLPEGVTMPPLQPEVPQPLFGFVEYAEILNSRVAMLGFVGILIVEGLTGRPALELMGLTVGRGLGFEF